MLKKYDEEYFEQLESVAHDRLEPGNIAVFFWSSLIVGAIVVILSALGLNDKVFIRYGILPILVKGAIILLVSHLVIAIIFTFEKIAYRFQRLQMILVTVVTFLLSISFYLFFFVLYNYSFAPGYVLTGAIALFVGGIGFLGWSTLRAINRIKQGHFKEDGDGMFDLKKSKIYIGVPIIFTFIILGGIAAKSLADISFDGEMYGILFFAVLIQYTIAIALPEFFLVAYCKFRFKSFIVEPVRVGRNEVGK